MFAATKVPGEMSTRVSPCAAPSDSNPIDKIANDAFRQFFSTDVRGKTPLGFAAFFMDCALLPPERRSHRLWLVGEVICVFSGLMLFFASTVGDFEATDTLGIVATCVGSFAVLALVVTCMFSAAPVMMCTTPDLTTTFAACKMLGWANFFLLNGAIMALSATRREIALQSDAVDAAARESTRIVPRSAAFVLDALARANGRLVGWIVCGMGIAFFFSLNVFFGTVAMAYLPLPQHHQQGWYYQAFAPNFALSNYAAGRKSVREGADIQLAKMLAGPIPDDLRLVLDGGPGA